MKNKDDDNNNITIIKIEKDNKMNLFNINIENKRNILRNLLLIKLRTNEVNYLFRYTIFLKFFAIQKIMAIIDIIYTLIYYCIVKDL